MPNPSPVFVITYNGEQLPGYSQGFDDPLSHRIAAIDIPGRDGGFLRGQGAAIRDVTLQMRVLTRLTSGTGLAHLNDCLDQYREALRILESANGAKANLYVGNTTRYLRAAFVGASAPLSASENRRLTYSVTFKADPYYLGETLTFSRPTISAARLTLTGDTGSALFTTGHFDGTSGVYLTDPTKNLLIPTAGNIQTQSGSLAFWLRPRYESTVASVRRIIDSGGPLTAYSTAMASTTPTAHWRLGEATGTTSANEAGGPVLNKVGAPTMGLAGLLTGDPNTAFDFPGADTDYFVTASTIDLPATWSLAAWIKPDSASGGIFLSNATVSGWYVRHLSSDITMSWLDSGAVQRTLATTTDAVPSGAVAFVVVTHDGTTARIYVNGAEVTNSATWNTQDSVASLWRVGMFASGGIPFDGTVDEPALWSRALGASEIVSLYEAGTEAWDFLFDSKTDRFGVRVGDDRQAFPDQAHVFNTELFFAATWTPSATTLYLAKDGFEPSVLTHAGNLWADGLRTNLRLHATDAVISDFVTFATALSANNIRYLAGLHDTNLVSNSSFENESSLDSWLVGNYWAFAYDDVDASIFGARVARLLADGSVASTGELITN